jgi:hypothetical protein
MRKKVKSLESRKEMGEGRDVTLALLVGRCRAFLPRFLGQTIDARAGSGIIALAPLPSGALHGEVAQWQSRGLISPWLMVQIHSSPPEE